MPILAFLLPLFSHENHIEKTMVPNGIPRCKREKKEKKKRKSVGRKNHGQKRFFRGEDEGGENARIIIDRNLQLIYEDTHNCTENRYYLFSMITTVIDPLFDLSNYSSLHCSFRICLFPKDLQQQLSRARSGILFDFQMPFLGNGRTQPPRRFPILGNATIRAFLRLKRVVCSVTSGRRAAVARSKRGMRVPCSAIIARYFGSLSERSGYGADNVYRFLPTSKKLSRVGVGDKVGGVGQTRPRLQTISSVRVPPLYLAFDRGLGVAPVRARTRKNTPPPPPSSSFVREIRLELFYIPRVKTPPSPFSLFFSFFSPQQIEIVARHRSSPIRS